MVAGLGSFLVLVWLLLLWSGSVAGLVRSMLHLVLCIPPGFPSFPLPLSGSLGEPTEEAQHKLLLACLRHVPPWPAAVVSVAVATSGSGPGLMLMSGDVVPGLAVFAVLTCAWWMLL